MGGQAGAPQNDLRFVAESKGGSKKSLWEAATCSGAELMFLPELGLVVRRFLVVAWPIDSPRFISR